MDSAAVAPPLEDRPAQADLLFSAPTYAEWVRRGMALKASRPTTATLFESTIAEPAPELVEVIRHAFSLQTTSRYVSVFAGGNGFAIEAVARRYGAPRDTILTTTGATSALALVLKAVVGPGDHVLVESPGFDLLAGLARESGALVEGFKRRPPSFAVDLDDLQARIGPRTRAILLTNLHNPSGMLLDRADILAIAKLADAVGAVVVVDEVYADFARPTQADTAATVAPNVITVSSLTKVFGLFAVKFGWLCAAPPLLARIRAASPDGDIGISKLAHTVAALVLEEPEVFDLHWKRVLSATRPVAQQRLKAMIADGLLEGAMPAFGCMAFPKVVGVNDTLALARKLWVHYDLLVAPGEFFGLPGHIRLGFGADAGAVDENFKRLHLALSDLRQPAARSSISIIQPS